MKERVQGKAEEIRVEVRGDKHLEVKGKIGQKVGEAKEVIRGRPDIDAAVRGGDWTQAMDREGVPGLASIAQALYWRQVYAEILSMEEKVLERIRELMNLQSDEVRHEVELTNVPVVVAQVERFRQRHGYWDARVHELDRATPGRVRNLPAPT